MNEIALRPYQAEFIDNVRKSFIAGKNHVVGVAPCGAGKTIMTGWIIRQTVKRGKSAVFFVHRKELIEQTAATFDKLGIRYGIIAGGIKPNYIYPVQIASVQTLVNRLEFIQPPDLLVCDECHHILAKTYLNIINTWNKSYLLGVTATPERTGGIKLCDVFNSMVLAPSTAELIKLGNLTQFDYFDAAPKDLARSLGGVGVHHGDYDNKQLAELMGRTKLVGNAVDNYLLKAGGKSAICYCVNIDHSVTVANAFNDAGIVAAQVDGSTDKDLRAYIVDQFRYGNIKILCNAELFGEGFDVPNCDCVILARPTKSLTLHIQQSMRSMRPNPANPNKRAIIIDCVGNYKQHGLPDTYHDWSLDPNKPKREGEPPPMKTCPKCGCLNYSNQRFCTGHYPDGRKCDYEFPIDPVIIEEDVKAKLVHKSENKKSVDTAPKIINAPTTIEEFLQIAAKENKKPYWAVYQALPYCKSYADCLHIAEVMAARNTDPDKWQKPSGWAWHKWEELKNGLAKSPDFC